MSILRNGQPFCEVSLLQLPGPELIMIRNDSTLYSGGEMALNEIVSILGLILGFGGFTALCLTVAIGSFMEGRGQG